MPVERRRHPQWRCETRVAAGRVVAAVGEATAAVRRVAARPSCSCCLVPATLSASYVAASTLSGGGSMEGASTPLPRASHRRRSHPTHDHLTPLPLHGAGTAGCRFSPVCGQGVTTCRFTLAPHTGNSRKKRQLGGGAGVLRHRHCPDARPPPATFHPPLASHNTVHRSNTPSPPTPPPVVTARTQPQPVQWFVEWKPRATRPPRWGVSGGGASRGRHAMGGAPPPARSLRPRPPSNGHAPPASATRLCAAPARGGTAAAPQGGRTRAGRGGVAKRDGLVTPCRGWPYSCAPSSAGTSPRRRRRPVWARTSRRGWWGEGALAAAAPGMLAELE